MTLYPKAVRYRNASVGAGTVGSGNWKQEPGDWCELEVSGHLRPSSLEDSGAPHPG